MTALLLVAGVHAGFQLVVTVVVYPALAEVPRERWEPAHRAHSRRIAILVVPLYAAILAVSAVELTRGPDGPAAWCALAAQGAAMAITATLAAPAHGRLGASNGDVHQMRRLLRVDRLRCAAAVTGLLAAAISSAAP